MPPDFTDEKTEAQRSAVHEITHRGGRCHPGAPSRLAGGLPHAYEVYSFSLRCPFTGAWHTCHLNPQAGEGVRTPKVQTGDSWRDAPCPGLAAPETLQRAIPHICQVLKPEEPVPETAGLARAPDRHGSHPSKYNSAGPLRGTACGAPRPGENRLRDPTPGTHESPPETWGWGLRGGQRPPRPRSFPTTCPGQARWYQSPGDVCWGSRGCPIRLGGKKASGGGPQITFPKGGKFLTPTSCPPIPCSPEAAFTSPGPTVASPLNLGTCYAQGLQKGRQGGWCRGPPEIWSRLENARDGASLYKLSGGRGRAAWFCPEGGGDECLVVGRSCKGEIKRPLA